MLSVARLSGLCPSSRLTEGLCFTGIQPVPLQTITNENPSGPSLGTTPQARFLLVMLSLLTLQHGPHNLDLLLNSGTLALTQTALRLIGRSVASASLCLFVSLFQTHTHTHVRTHFYLSKHANGSFLFSPHLCLENQ